MSKPVKTGDIVEIPVKGGFAYAQYILKHEKYGAMILVFPTIHDTPLKDFSELRNDRKHYVTFFPLAAAVKQTIFNIVDNQPIPEHSKEFPLFKTGIQDKSGKVETWWIWDGEKEWKVGKLTDEQRKFPERGIWNDTLLINRIERGWSPEDLE